MQFRYLSTLIFATLIAAVAGDEKTDTCQGKNNEDVCYVGAQGQTDAYQGKCVACLCVQAPR